MRHPKMFLPCLATSILLAACGATSYDLEFDTSYAEQIERGVTTKSDVRSNIGEPNTVTLKPDSEVWAYIDLEGGTLIDAHKVMFRQKQKVRGTALQITFSGDVVTDYSLTTTKVDATCR